MLSDPSTTSHRSHQHLSDVIDSKLRCSKSFFLLKRGTCKDPSSVKAGGTLGRGVLRSPSAGNDNDVQAAENSVKRFADEEEDEEDVDFGDDGGDL